LGGRVGYDPSVRPKTYMTEAILVTLLCCLPFGIAAIVFASQVDSKFNTGDYEGAQKASNSAKTWYHVALISGFVVIVIWLIASAAGSN
jgi:succinate dehydrogenase/fumarate reductase cytochrome b subunit